VRGLIVLIISFSCISAPAHAGIRFGQGTKTVATSGTALAILSSSKHVTSIIICGDTGNTGKIAVAQNPVAAAGAQQGVILSPGGCVVIEGHSDPPVKFDAAIFKVDATVSGDKASFFYVVEEN